MYSEFSTGIRHFFSATAFLSKHKLLYFYLIPFFLSVLFYIGITAAIVNYSGQIAAWLLEDIFSDARGEMFSGSWSLFKFIGADALQYAAGALIGILIFLLSSKLSKYIILILLSPLFAYLSELVEEKLTGKTYDMNLPQFTKDIIRGILIALRNFLIEMALIALFTAIGWLGGPLIVLIAPFLWLVGAYFYGFSMLDYTCERRRMPIGKGIRFIRSHRWLAIANGGLYSIFDMVPLIGLAIAPVNAVVGATTAIIEIENTMYGSNT